MEAMNTKYQLWLTHNAESEKIQLPVLPEKFTVSIGSKNESMKVVELGEIVIKQSRPAYQFSFSSFFPAGKFPGIAVDQFHEPLWYVAKIKSWIESKKPVHLILTNLQVNLYCTIEKFSYSEKGGDIGTIQYDLTLKEYREPVVRTVKIAASASAVTKVENRVATVTTAPTRVNNTTNPRTYTVKRGDCLWNIAKKFYGNGSKYTDIVSANQNIFKKRSPNLIYPGEVLVIP